MLQTLLFVQRFQSVDFASKHAPKRYVYSGFGDFLFSEKGSLWKEKYCFFVSIRVRPKIVQVLCIYAFYWFWGFEKCVFVRFCETSFLDVFFILIGKCAYNSHTYAKWDPPFKIELPKKDRKMRSRSGQKTDFGGPFSVWSGGLNVLKTRIRPSNVVVGGVWWERRGHSDFKCWN